MWEISVLCCRKKPPIDQKADATAANIVSGFESLPDDLLDTCLSFVGPGNYRFVAGTCRRFQKRYDALYQKETAIACAAASVGCAKFSYMDAVTSGRLQKDRAIDMIQRGAASVGQVAVLDWALSEQRGASFLAWTRFENDNLRNFAATSHFEYAVASGHLGVLEWAQKRRVKWFSSSLIRIAADHEQVEILDFIRMQCQLQDQSAVCPTTEEKINLSISVTEYATASGHVSVLEWTRENGLLSVALDEWTCAVRKGHANVLQWLFERGCWRDVTPQFGKEMTIDNAAFYGQISVIEWALDSCMEFDERTCYSAAFGGRLETLQWLRERECPWDWKTITFARTAPIAQWARNNGCPERDEHFGLEQEHHMRELGLEN